MSEKELKSCGEGACCSGRNEIGRREFLRWAGLGVAAAAGWPAMAGPFEAEDFESLVPSDKKLSPQWIESLFARGARAVYRGDDLDKIGMPIGGICTGQLYLGGDGRLWHWDIFNQHIATGAEHYAQPMRPESPLAQGFAIRIADDEKPQVRTLDRKGFSDVSFCGEYPMAFVEYRDAGSPVSVSLEAFSPFIPLNADDSNLPVTILQFTVKNESDRAVACELAGWLENAVCLHSGQPGEGVRRNRITRNPGWTFLECSAEAPPKEEEAANRPDIVFEDFEKETYEGWTVTGTAFGSGPIEKKKMPAYQGDVGAQGERLVNTHNTRQGEDVTAGDAHTGTLLSRPFTIERCYINFLIGGGAHKGKTCIDLLIDDRVVRSATGRNDNRMQPHSFDVGELEGKTARLEIVDTHQGGWGNIGVDAIDFSDKPAVAPVALRERADFGTMGLMLLGKERDPAYAMHDSADPKRIWLWANFELREYSRPFGDRPSGALLRKLQLDAGQSEKVTFAVVWHFPNLRMENLRDEGGRHYADRFDSAGAVAKYVVENFDRLAGQTRLWHDTWYDSTLPRWFLDRTFANASILASSTCHWFRSGRFYGWEGVGCCAGTCAHVWHYAHAVARLFPSLERAVREMADYGVAFDGQTGAIRFRGEFNNEPAIDGQAGCVLRAYREHQMSADGVFLARLWPAVKKSLEYLIREDANADGLIEGKQHNTLDTDWYGPVAWLSSLYLAALRAGEEMAREMGDAAFANEARAIFERGRRNLVERLWNSEYFIHKPDPNHTEAMKSGNGCEIDQVFGQSWAFQVGLGRVLPEEQVRQALRSLWRYNFTPDVGPYRNAFKSGRWYAMPGEAGLLMCTWPKGDRANTQGQAPDWAYGYFNECMTGFEYQAAGHMIWEGMPTEGLAITRAIHDRYHPSRRNPWNEVECGDHYARAMASYGVYLAACGFEYHGPRGRLGFAPRLAPEDFRAAFTTAEGWGTFAQKREGAEWRATIEMKWGRLRLKTLALGRDERVAPENVRVELDGEAISATHALEAGRLVLRFEEGVEIREGQRLSVVFREFGAR